MTGNVVTVFRCRLGKSRAECSCGWEGKRRLTGTRAALDALLHSDDDIGCQPDWPLILHADRTGRIIVEKVMPVGSLILFCVALGWAIAALVQVGI